MRFTGLVDSAGVYETYRVPNPQAPYPQDYIIDQAGIVRYWSDQFDAQAVIGTIDQLLATGVETPRIRELVPRLLEVRPNPFRTRARLSCSGSAPGTAIAVYDGSGRVVRNLKKGDAGTAVVWDGCDDAGRRVENGVYFAVRAGPGPVARARLVLID